MLSLLKKYRYEIKTNKTQLYKKLAQQENVFKNAGFSVSLKTPIDLFDCEVTLKGILAKQDIDECYDKFVSANYDTFDYINYEEKRKMFNHDVDLLISNKIYFLDNQSQKEIYMPQLEPFVNDNYTHDYQVMTLKQHALYLRDYPHQQFQARLLYGLQSYHSDFSSLQYIGQDDEFEYFYYHEFKSVMIFKKEDASFYNELCICDKYCKKEIDVGEVKELVALFLNSDDDASFVQLLVDHEMMSDKVAKKILKKISRRK